VCSHTNSELRNAKYMGNCQPAYKEAGQVVTGDFSSVYSGEFRLVFDGELKQRMAALQSEFVADVGAVVVNRAVMYVQFFGDLFAGFIFGN
jgi:hypothetical protein